MTTTHHDFAVIGAGIAGASAAYELAAHGSVVLLEREPLPGYHTTGRSAAFVVESYGNRIVRTLTRAGRGFLERPPEGFAPNALVEPCPVLWIAREDQRESIAAASRSARETDAGLRSLSAAEALELCPALRADYVAEAVLEPGALSIDVAGLLEGYLRGLRLREGELVTKADVTSLESTGAGWSIETSRRSCRARVVVNAAGAWSDAVAELAGAAPVGLAPLRRTAITFDPPDASDARSWPCVIDVDEQFYFKPEGATLLASPCDETPSLPCDVTPEDYDVALAAERIQRATTIEIPYVRRRWAGLRSFVADRSPVIGFDPQRRGFFWLAGQGGFGIMTAPAASRCAAALIVDHGLPPDVVALGLRAEQLSPARPELATA